MVLVRDHLGLVKEGTALPSRLFEFLAMLNGEPTIIDLQTELMRLQGGVLVDSQEVEGLLSHLDENFLLDSEQFQQASQRMIREFQALSIRPCALCGQAYPKEAAKLQPWLDAVLKTGDGPPQPRGPLRALVAPHIDPSTGARVYAAAYGALSETRPSKVVILGTGHNLSSGLFCFTEKDFQTPLGVASNEVEITRELARAAGGAAADNDFAHCFEHSLEFQILFLQHLFGDAFTVVPVLCGSLLAGLDQYSREAFLNQAGAFLDKLKELLQQDPQETLLVAGVDFSHIGPKFGHPQPALHLQGLAMDHDKSLMQHVKEQEADLFWRESIKTEDRFNVCGFSSLACLLEVLPPCSGRILDYQMQHEQPTQSAVGFAAMAFFAQD
jgi:AmmeMemoRadiSam system protein B